MRQNGNNDAKKDSPTKHIDASSFFLAKKQFKTFLTFSSQLQAKLDLPLLTFRFYLFIFFLALPFPSCLFFFFFFAAVVGLLLGLLSFKQIPENAPTKQDILTME